MVAATCSPSLAALAATCSWSLAPRVRVGASGAAIGICSGPRVNCAVCPLRSRPATAGSKPPRYSATSSAAPTTAKWLSSPSAAAADANRPSGEGASIFMISGSSSDGISALIDRGGGISACFTQAKSCASLSPW